MIATGTVQLLVIVMLLAFLMRGVPAAYRATAPRYEIREWLGTSVPLVLMAFFLVIVNRADLLLVGAFLGREQAGIYTAVLSTSEALGIFVRVGVLVSTPDIAPYFVKHDQTALQNLMTWTARFCFIPALAGGIVLAFFGREILGWFGPGFEVGYPALLIAIVEELVRAGLGVPGRLLVIAGERMAVARSLIGGAVVDLVLLVLLVHPLGLVGAAIAGGMATLTTQLYLAYETRKQLHVDTTVVAPTVPAGSAA
jgi:O-antigen/teichoic acid export membrane protein